MWFETYGWLVPIFIFNLIAITMALGKFPPPWFQAPNIKGREQYYRTVFRAMGIVFLGIEIVAGLLGAVSSLN